MEIKRVIIDLDAGTDDALALLLFLRAEELGEIQIEAIVCTNGNTKLEHICRNVVRLLETAGRTDIPIYKGSHQPILPIRYTFQPFHGEDGFGDLEHETEPNTCIIQNEISASALHRIVTDNPQQITLICLGPLTNAAIPIRMFEDFASNVKDIYIMGGNYNGVGNVTAAAEFNFYTDPEAADIVFECLKCPIYLLPWECCAYTSISFKWRREILGQIGGPLWKLIDKAEQSIYKDCKDSETWMPCDAFVALAYLYPEAIIQQTNAHVSIELHGSRTRGQVVLDHLNKSDKNTVLIQKIDEEFFKDIVLKACADA